MSYNIPGKYRKYKGWNKYQVDREIKLVVFRS